MALSRRDRDLLRADVLTELRHRWGQRGDDAAVELVLQVGRKRPRVTGRVVYVATSGAYALLADGCEPDESIGETAGPLHVPIDRVRRVSTRGRAGFRQVIPKPSPVPERKDPT